MAYEFDGLNDYLIADGGVIGSQESIYPMSISCWFYATANAIAQGLVSVTSTSNARNIHLALHTDDTVAARSRSGSDSPAYTSTTFTKNTWNNAIGVWNGTVSATNTSRSAYLNGGGKQTNSTSVTTMGLQNAHLNIGSRLALTTRLNYFTGYIAEVAFWQAALTDDDALQLATGVSPLKVKPEAIVFYSPLIRELTMPVNRKAQEFTSSLDYASLTASGAVAANTHMRRFG